MKQLTELIAQIKNPGCFSVGGKLDAIYPGLKINNLGTVALPLLKHQAEQLISLCEQAPFGRGEQTLVDTNIRNVWQLPPSAFEITNPHWQASLEKSIGAIAKQLGLEGCRISASLYKLLVYKAGSFFIPHRDTEKVPNMFATLVIHLPSPHEGGELIVSHGDKSQSYSFTDEFQPEFVAFYADCYHEIKPVTAGYRLCLIYNLSIADREQPPLLSRQLEIADQITKSLQHWSWKELTKPIQACLLEHSYSKENLCLNNLKNGDFAKASVLLNAAENSGCQAFLCLVSFYRLSYGDCYGMGYDRYRRHDSDEGDFEEYGVEDEKIFAHHLVSPQGLTIALKNLALDETDLQANIPLTGGEGKQVRISEATGNEGATKELWYHRGAVILWPKRCELDIALLADEAYGIHALQQWMQTKDISKGDTLQKVLKLAHHLVDTQSPHTRSHLLTNLIQIGDLELLNSFISKRLNNDLNGLSCKELISVLETFGWEAFTDNIDKVVRHHLRNSYYAEEVVPWLYQLLLEENLSDQGRQMIAQWFQTVWISQMPWKNGLDENNLKDLLQMTALLDVQALTNEVLAMLSNHAQDLFLIDTYGPAVISAYQSFVSNAYDTDILNRFAQDVLNRLEQAYPNPPSPPENWQRSGQVNCECEFCTQVNQLLPDPVASDINFHKTLKRNLIHVEERISRAGVDLSITIERDPPKFKGHCYKNQNSYDRSLQLFTRAQDIKTILRNL